MIYISLVMILVFFEIINIFTNGYFRNISKFILIVIGIVLVIIAGSRDGIGYDYYSYENIFNDIKIAHNSIFSSSLEKGYYLLNLISNSFHMVLIISAIICVYSKSYIINKSDGHIYIGLALYISTIFMVYDMGVIRQGLAMSVIIFSIKYIERRNIKKFILVILIAMLFHMSAIVFIPAYFIVNKDIKRKYIYLTTFICFIIGMTNLGQGIFKVGNSIFTGILGKKLNFYYSSIYNTSTFSITSLKRIFLLIIFTEFIKKYCKNNGVEKIYLNIYFIGCCIYYSLKSFGLFSDRGSAYYNWIEILLFSILIRYTKSKWGKIIILLIATLYCFYNISKTINAGASTMQLYAPYKSIFLK